MNDGSRFDEGDARRAAIAYLFQRRRAEDTKAQILLAG
jgi:hypothetical protein